MSNYHLFTLELEVDSPGELYKAALAHAIAHDGQTEDYAITYLRPEGEIDTCACLQTLLDPGSLAHAGCSILQSAAQSLEVAP